MKKMPVHLPGLYSRRSRDISDVPSRMSVRLRRVSGFITIVAKIAVAPRTRAMSAMLEPKTVPNVRSEP